MSDTRGPTDLATVFGELSLPKQYRADGSPNPDFYRFQLDYLNLKRMQMIRDGEPLPSNFAAHVKSIEYAAELAGFTPAYLADSRSQEDRDREAILRLVEEPATIAEVGGECLDRMERLVARLEAEMDKADSLCEVQIRSEVEAARARAGGVEEGDGAEVAGVEALSPAKKKRRAGRVKRLRGLLARVRTMHRRAGPREAWKPSRSIGDAARDAAHVLRFMLWVGRSNIAENRAMGAEESVFLISSLHAKMAVGLWEAQLGVEYLPDPKPGVVPYEGAILVAPPRHGKTEIGSHWLVRMIVENPFTQAKIGHAKEGMASQNLKYCASCFDMSEANGRRLKAIYPDMPPLAERDNNAMKMRVVVGGGRLKDPTIEAAGVNSAISGSGATAIWLDDPVDQKEAEQDEERRRKFDRINGTWMTRKTGRRAFDLTTTTLWHEDDANVRRIRMAAAGESMLRVVICPAGGPDTEPKFFSAFPELYGPDYLRAKYHAFKNAPLYACAYQCNPSTSHVRRIKELRYFDPQSHEHAEFMRMAEFGLSVDPAGTNRVGSDPAGLVYYGMGQVEQEHRTDDCREWRVEKQLRVIHAVEVPSTQSEIARYMVTYAKERPVDTFHVETRSGYAGTAEMLETFLGINEVVRHDPGPKKKAIRLQAVAGFLDHSLYRDGGPGACVLFPGKRREDGSVGPDPNMEWLYEQFEKFGFVKNDHCVDALTQVVNMYSDKLREGTTGSVTRRVWTRGHVMPGQKDEDLQRLVRSLTAKGKDRGFGGNGERDFHVAASSNGLW